MAGIQMTRRDAFGAIAMTMSAAGALPAAAADPLVEAGSIPLDGSEERYYRFFFPNTTEALHQLKAYKASQKFHIISLKLTGVPKMRYLSPSNPGARPRWTDSDFAAFELPGFLLTADDVDVQKGYKFILVWPPEHSFWRNSPNQPVRKPGFLVPIGFDDIFLAAAWGYDRRDAIPPLRPIPFHSPKVGSYERALAWP